MGRWSCTVLIEAESRHQAEQIVEEMTREGNRYLTPKEGRVRVSPLMTEAEAH